MGREQHPKSAAQLRHAGEVLPERGCPGASEIGGRRTAHARGRRDADVLRHTSLTGEADAVFLARAMIRNPRWALSAAEKLGVKIDWPHQLERGQTI